MGAYFDHNATTPLDPEVLEAMMPYLREEYGNPSSQHRWGRAAREAVAHARAQVAELVNAGAAELVFTGGGTEANNLAIKGAAAALPKGALAVSAIEHSSVLASARAMRDDGWRLHEIAVDGQGRVTAAALAAAMPGDIRLVSVMSANNETGTVQDVAALAALAAERGALFHTDAIQAAGKIALDFTACGARLMSLSAHKIGGPKGIGALLVDRSVDLAPVLHGGGQEGGRRSGTENVAGIVGFGAAAAKAARDIAVRARRLRELRERLEAGLATLPGVEIHGRGAERLANTVCFTADGVDGSTLLLMLDQDGFGISSGSACGSGRPEPSHVLLAMGVDRERAYGALRVSLGLDNDESQIDDFLRSLAERLAALRALGSLGTVAGQA
jgi:cysteine desulfurase